MLSQLPDLEGTLKEFMRGAKETFTWFTKEFRDDGGIAGLTDEEKREELFFASTNNVNKGGLGTMQIEKRKRPNQMVKKQSARYMHTRNESEIFNNAKLTDAASQKFIRKTARMRDASGLQRKRKAEHIEAGKAKVAENSKRQKKREKIKEAREAKIKATEGHLCLGNADIDKLTVSQLNKQLKYHRAQELKFPDEPEKVPPISKIGNRTAKITELKQAVLHYSSRHLAAENQSAGISNAAISQPGTLPLPVCA